LTYNKLQLQLQELFNALSAASNELAKSKEKLLKAEQGLVKLKEDLEVAEKNRKKIKKNKVVNLNSFSVIKHAKEDAHLNLTKGKLDFFAAKKEVEVGQKQIAAIKQQYENIEKLAKKALGNIERFNNA
jgi:chromosome segregation ATPase